VAITPPQYGIGLADRGQRSVTPPASTIVVGAADDPLEREADRVADRVMSMQPIGTVGTSTIATAQRKCTSCDEEKRLQRKPAGASSPSIAPISVSATISTPGSALDPQTRAFFEARFARDLGGVRVHDDATADASARSIGARAYTVGEHVAFKHGEYAPSTNAGRRLLAHELAHVVQQSRGAPQRVQRDLDDPALAQQFQAELSQLAAQARQDRDLSLRAYAHRAILLMSRPHPAFASQSVLDAFIDRCMNEAATESETVAALGAWAEFGIASVPQAFPRIWSGRIHEALSLGVDETAALREVFTRRTALQAEAGGLPARLLETGLPVPLAEAARLGGFDLQLRHVRVRATHPVGAFARSTVRFAQLTFYATFAITWERLVNEISEAVADGRYVPQYSDYTDFRANRESILRSLPQRARDRLAMSEEELRAIEHDAVGLADAALLAGMFGGLAGLLGIMHGWQTGERFFDRALVTTDGLVAAAAPGQKELMAFRWIWESGYVSDALLESLEALIESGPEILRNLAIIVVLQMIPYVNVAVDVYLMAQLGLDVIMQLGELGAALQDVLNATTTVQLQRASARLARVLVAGGIQILMTLVTMGVARGVSALRARTAAIRARNAALSEEAAMERAMREAPRSERAPLERAQRVGERSVREWERGLNPETRPILETPGVRARLAQLSERARRLLTMCESPCLPPAHELLALDVERLEAVLRRIGVTGESRGLREYFHRRRDTLVRAIDDLDRGVRNPAELQEFLDRAVIAAAGRSTGSIFRDALRRFVYRRLDGMHVTEYDIARYRVHRGDFGTRGFFQSHHGVQGEWAQARGIPGFAYDEAPCILLRNSHAGSPHQIITARQVDATRVAGRATRTYPQERALMRGDLQAAGVPEQFIHAAEQANDVYYAELYRAAQRAGRSAQQLRRWFGEWTP
jgi:hypothetical protein